MDKKIGFIGLGAMGKPMAVNLLKAGYELVCHDLNGAAVGELVSLGAEEAKSGADIAGRCRIVITMLPADKQITQVYTAPEGILNGAREGTVCIDMTSAMGETLRAIAAMATGSGKKISFLDAPVSGGVPAAENGTLTIMAGGERSVFDNCMGILKTVGGRIHYTGALGSGKDVKTINQLLNAGNTCIMSEALYLAKRMNIDMDILCDVIKESSGNSWVFTNNVPKYILPESFENGFALALMHKDVSLGLEQARAEQISMPVLNLISQIYQSMCSQGYVKSNYNVVSQWIERQNKRKE